MVTGSMRVCISTKPALPQMLKELLQTGNRGKRPTENKPKTIMKMVMGSYISIITLNANGLNAPTKKNLFKILDLPTYQFTENIMDRNTC